MYIYISLSLSIYMYIYIYIHIHTNMTGQGEGESRDLRRPGRRSGARLPREELPSLTDGIGTPDPNLRHLVNWCL